jgi:hypothetical protein
MPAADTPSGMHRHSGRTRNAAELARASEQARATSRRMRALAAALILVVIILMTAGCGGESSATATQGTGGIALSAAQLAIAEKLYAGSPRTPADFYIDPPLAAASGTVSTLHLKNDDLNTGAAARFELCSDDLGQALSWSETKASTQGTYADMVEVNANARYFEVVRVPRNDSSARERHRVFRCSYVDRSATDLASDTGSAGRVNIRPITAAELRQLSEYLWQFTLFNNADHVVLESRAGSGNATLTHDIDMARLTRAASAGGCDRIELLRWTHSVDALTGLAQRRLGNTDSFQARRVGGAIQACSG